MIKTIALTGAEQEVKFAGTHTYYWVQNLGGGDVLVGLEPELADGKDDVLIVPPGSAGYVRDDRGTKAVYLSGTGRVQVYGTNNAFSPFKSGAKGGGGGEVTTEGDELKGTVDYPILSLNLYGKSVQNGTPTPDAPVDVVSVGDSGVVGVASSGKNLLPNIVASGVKSGVTITVNNDKSITLNGTATATDWINYNYVSTADTANGVIAPNVEYTISAEGLTNGLRAQFGCFLKNGDKVEIGSMTMHKSSKNGQ